MSRSVKKLPNYNDGNKVDKQIHKRRLRHRNKVRVDVGLEPFVEDEIVNKYNVKDYNWTDFENKEENKKWKRK